MMVSQNALNIPQTSIDPNTRKILWWLGSTLFLLWLMVMLGGATRLTHSGLSMVEWKPITGIIPPLSTHDWMMEFDKYKLHPEYILLNNGMSLSEFKFIYIMEYAHRVLGRLIGLVFFVPLALLWRKLSTPTRKKSLLLLGLGALQGCVGWYMVKSGLSKSPHVSHYRLTMHLGMAFTIIAIMTALFMDHLNAAKHRDTHPVKKPVLFFLTLGFMVCALIFGGFVAGLKAGLIYNTFPLMGGDIFPGDGLFLKPAWINFFENQSTVQWTHRVLATMVLLHAGLFYRQNLHANDIRIWFLLVCTQYVLGIVTLIHMVPVSLGTLHQGMAVLLIMATTVVFKNHNFTK